MSIDDKILASMVEQGASPGLAKLPGAPMIVSNPAYPDAPQAQTQDDQQGSPPLPPSRPTVSQLPPARPANVESSQYGNNDASDGAGKGTTDRTQYAGPDYANDGAGKGTQVAQGGDRVGAGTVAGVGGAGLLAALLLARKMRGQSGDAVMEMPPEAGGAPTPNDPRLIAARDAFPQVEGPQKMLALPKPDTIYQGQDEQPKQITDQSKPADYATDGELVSAKDVMSKPKGEVPDGGSQIPALNDGGEAGAVNSPDAPDPVATPKRSRSSKAAVQDAKVTLPSGAQTTQGAVDTYKDIGSKIQDVLARSLADPTAAVESIRGASKLRMPRGRF